MTHFDFKTLLPALLQVEDRVSMAHGLESRVPLLDHRLVELGRDDSRRRQVQGREHEARLQARGPRRWFRQRIAERKDKMGFPVPLSEWLRGDARRVRPPTRCRAAAALQPADCSTTARCSPASRARDGSGARSGACSCLELWQQTFHDRSALQDASDNERTDG